MWYVVMNLLMNHYYHSYSYYYSYDVILGYYMTTLDAAIHHIVHMADDYNASLSQNNK